MWFWHAPVPYEATFHGAAVYWTMHLTLLGAAFWLWSALLFHHSSGSFWALAAGLGASLQMALLGALLTLASRAFYAPHALTTQAWGLTPLQDQQVGGAILWVPGGAIFVLVAMRTLLALFTEPPAARESSVG